MDSNKLWNKIEELETKINHIESNKKSTGYWKRVFHKTPVVIGIVLTFIISSVILYAATVVKPNTFTSGTVISASEVNSNFDTLYTLVNGNIDNDNISSSANIAQSKISGGPFASASHTHSENWTNAQDFAGSTSSTSWVDVPGSSVTITTTGGDLYTSLSCRMGSTSYPGYVRIRIDSVDASLRAGASTGQTNQVSIQHVFKGLSAATYTVKAQYAHGNGSGTVYIFGSIYSSSLFVREMK